MGAKENFSSKLKMLREEYRLSQTQLAEILGVSRVTISYYENGERTADIDFIYKTAVFFTCSTDYLLGLSAFKNNEDKEKFHSYIENINQQLENIPKKDKNNLFEAFNCLLNDYLHLDNDKKLQAYYLSSIKKLIELISVSVAAANIIEAAITPAFKKEILKKSEKGLLEEVIIKTQKQTTPILIRAKTNCIAELDRLYNHLLKKLNPNYDTSDINQSEEVKKALSQQIQKLLHEQNE